MKLTAEQIDNLFNNGYAYLPQLKFSDIENVMRLTLISNKRKVKADNGFAGGLEKLGLDYKLN